MGTEGLMLLAGVQQVLDNGPNWTEVVSCLAACAAVLVTVVIFWLKRKRDR